MRRVAWIDIAKALAIFAIVFGHTLRGGDMQAFVYSFHVPLFFILSGMTFTVNTPWKNFVRKKFLQIICPYLVFGFLSILAYMIMGEFAARTLGVASDLSLLDCVIGLAYGAGDGLKFNTPLWFLPCLFLLENITYGFLKLRNMLFKNQGIAVRAAYSVVVSALCVGFAYALNALFNFDLPFSIVTALSMLPFFMLGEFVRPVIQKPMTARLRNYLGYAALLALLGGLFFVINYASLGHRVDYPTNMYGNYLLFFIAAVFESCAILFLCIGIGHSRLLESVGRQTLAILCMHKFPVLVFQTMVPGVKNLLISENIFVAAIVALIALCLCLVVAYPIKRYFPWMLGLQVRHLDRARVTSDAE